MSFVVGGGIVFNTTDLAEIHFGLRAWRMSMMSRTKERACRFFAREITELIDWSMARGQPAPGSPYSIVRRKHNTDKESGRSKLDVEFSIFISVFEGKVYGNVLAPDRVTFEAFLRTKLAKPFAYWDNTDRMKGVSEKAWNERRRIWDGIFSNQYKFTDGFVADCTPKEHTYTVLNAEEIVRYIDPLDKRAKRAAHEIVVARRIEIDEDRSQYGKVSADDYMITFSGIYMKACDWVDGTEQGQTMLALETNHLKGILVPITKEML